MVYYIVAVILAICNIFLGASCKATIFYATTFLVIGCSSVVAYAMETKARNVFCVLGAVVYAIVCAYAILRHTVCGVYCADYMLVAVQMLIMSVYTLFSVKQTKNTAV